MFATLCNLLHFFIHSWCICYPYLRLINLYLRFSVALQLVLLFSCYISCSFAVFICWFCKCVSVFCFFIVILLHWFYSFKIMPTYLLFLYVIATKLDTILIDTIVSVILRLLHLLFYIFVHFLHLRYVIGKYISSQPIYMSFLIIHSMYFTVLLLWCFHNPMPLSSFSTNQIILHLLTILLPDTIRLLEDVIKTDQLTLILLILPQCFIAKYI